MTRLSTALGFAVVVGFGLGALVAMTGIRRRRLNVRAAATVGVVAFLLVMGGMAIMEYLALPLSDHRMVDGKGYPL